MSEMVERVARALAASVHENFDTAPERRDFMTGSRDDWLDFSRAAITAMREPTQDMLEAVAPLPVALIEQRKAVPGYDMQMRAAAHADQMTACSQWQIMIDAALSEGDA